MYLQTGERGDAAVASLNFSGVPMLGRMMLAGPDSVRDLAVESSLEGECCDCCACWHPFGASHKVLPTFFHHEAKDTLPLPGVCHSQTRTFLFF